MASLSPKSYSRLLLNSHMISETISNVTASPARVIYCYCDQLNVQHTSSSSFSAATSDSFPSETRKNTQDNDDDTLIPLEQRDQTQPDTTSFTEHIQQQMSHFGRLKSGALAVVASLALPQINLHLPQPSKVLARYQKFIPRRFAKSNTDDAKQTSDDSSCVSSKMDESVRMSKTDEITPHRIRMIVKDIEDNVRQFPDTVKKLRTVLEVSQQLVVYREQHTFEKAMEDTHESISSFHTKDGLDTASKFLPLPGGKPISAKTSKDRPSLGSPDTGTRLASAFVSPSGIAGDMPKPKTDEDSGYFGLLTKLYRRKGNGNVHVKDKKPLIRHDFVSRIEIDRRTQQLVESLKMATTHQSQLVRMEDLCKQLIEYPDTRAVALKAKVVPLLLRLRESYDQPLQEQARQTLVLVGHVDPVKGRGIRMLAIDGGGTSALNTIEILKGIEQVCQKEIRQLFDYACGVSTGSLLIALVFMYNVPLDECERIYKDFSFQMFTRNSLLGTGNLVWSHAYYDTSLWEDVLKLNMGDRLLIDSAKDGDCAKLAALSCISNTTRMKNFIFRNYNLPPDVLAHQPGNCKHKVWEIIRASSAAPGYYEEMQLGDYIHQDGGLLTNNPTAIGIHECKLLWPNESLQCVVSLGTGRYEPSLEISTTSKSSLKEKISKIVDSATDTEAINHVLQDLLPPSTYFRFNPYVSEDYGLSEIRPDKQEQMQYDTKMYIRKNDYKLQMAAQQLLLPRRKHQKVRDWLKHIASMI